jgi:hypothetical protein
MRLTAATVQRVLEVERDLHRMKACASNDEPPDSVSERPTIPRHHLDHLVHRPHRGLSSRRVLPILAQPGDEFLLPPQVPEPARDETIGLIYPLFQTAEPFFLFDQQCLDLSHLDGIGR